MTAYQKRASILLIVSVIAPIISLFLGKSLAPLLVATIVLMSYQIYRNNKWRLVEINEISFIVYLIVFWSLITILWTPDPEFALDGWFRIAFIGLTAMMVVRYASLYFHDQLHLIRIFSVIGVVLSTLISLFESQVDIEFLRTYMHSPDFSLLELNRGASTIALFVWPAAMALRRKSLRIALIAFVFSVLLCLESLSAIVGVASGACAYLVIKSFNRLGFKIIRYLTMIIFISFPFVMANFEPNHESELQSQIPAMAMHRLYIWDFTAEKAMEKPYWGWGFNSSRFLPDGNKEILPGQTLMPLHPHNSIMQIWVELGLVGVLLFLMLIWFCLKRIEGMNANIQMRAGCMALAISYLAIGSSAFGIWQNWWIAAGVLAASVTYAVVLSHQKVKSYF